VSLNSPIAWWTIPFSALMRSALVTDSSAVTRNGTRLPRAQALPVSSDAEEDLLEIPIKDSLVRALVSLIEDDQGGYRLAVELHAQLPGIDRAQAQRVMEEAHKTCPYSKALRGDTAVKLMVD
jgi:hypothetical protein